MRSKRRQSTDQMYKKNYKKHTKFTLKYHTINKMLSLTPKIEKNRRKSKF